ncbi:MAG TPA: VOC family protein [Caulobacteraceae bacterium]
MAEAKRPTLSSAVYYRDPRAALKWLESAFGYETTMVVENPDGTIGHSEMRFGDGLIMVGYEYDARHKSPASVGRVNTQSVHVQLDADIDGHFARAKAAGATVVREIEDQFYGDRNYIVADPDGHVWSFGQTVKTMTNDEMAKAGGVAVRERL